MSNQLTLPFECHGLSGRIEVDIVATTDPGSVGGDADNAGFPNCTARVRFAGRGYRAMFGWIQLVRSTDAPSDRFEMDPFLLFPDADSPYAFYGHLPTLFDAPGRSHRRDMRWEAHSFLAATPIERGARHVTALQGFSWGFRIADAQLRLAAAAGLPPDTWNEHRPFLTATYPSWHFEHAARWPH